jgi:hypothetical protein
MSIVIRINTLSNEVYECLNNQLVRKCEPTTFRSNVGTKFSLPQGEIAITPIPTRTSMRKRSRIEETHCPKPSKMRGPSIRRDIPLKPQIEHFGVLPSQLVAW